MAASSSRSPLRPASSTWCLYGRGAAAKDAGVSPDGSGSHRIAIVNDTGPFTEPDGFVWEAPRSDWQRAGSATAAIPVDLSHIHLLRPAP
jgi:hypothetical protein